jgi:hypothetical protein
MSYVDLIIKYLSGDLSSEESRAFESRLESDAGLKAAFEEQSAAYQLIREQLQKRDQEVFERKLAEAMDPHVPFASSEKPLQRLWWIPPAIAGLLALVLILFLHRPGNERLFYRYYDPASDPLVLAYYQDTRGNTEPGINHYRQGNFEKAMDLLAVRISEEKENKLFQLYFLLSALELDREQEAIPVIELETAPFQDLLEQSIRWYTVLALIKSERRDEAFKLLKPLTDQAGSYQADALRLEKVLLK